jgi:hypothetical protein
LESDLVFDAVVRDDVVVYRFVDLDNQIHSNPSLVGGKLDWPLDIRGIEVGVMRTARPVLGQGSVDLHSDRKTSSFKEI